MDTKEDHNGLYMYLNFSCCWKIVLAGGGGVFKKQNLKSGKLWKLEWWHEYTRGSVVCKRKNKTKSQTIKFSSKMSSLVIGINHWNFWGEKGNIDPWSNHNLFFLWRLTILYSVSICSNHNLSYQHRTHISNEAIS